MKNGNLSPASKKALLAWFGEVRRALPWRETSDPYKIWVSEVMLQQTQVKTVIPFYLKWLGRFPNVHALAEAEEADVLACWQGLGYYRRCRMLLQGARYVSEHGFPDEVTGWRKVPGVGPYTAGAICSIALGLPTPLVDGNVSRVYARLAGDDSAPANLEKKAWGWAGANLVVESPRQWNEALMELGATVCTPKRPKCRECPLIEECWAAQNGVPEDFPRASPKIAQVLLVRTCVIHKRGPLVGVEQIPRGEWWEGMWRFPVASADHVREDAGCKYLGSVRHSVTKHRITMEVFLQEREGGAGELRWVDEVELGEIAMPTPQRRAFELSRKVAWSFGFG